MASRLVETADQRVPITLVCGLVGIPVPEGLQGSWKTLCPNDGIFHDASVGRCFRVYPETNSCWCFAGCGYYTPVKLYLTHVEGSEEDAAATLLDKIGYQPESPYRSWEAVRQLSEPPVDVSSLAQALGMWAQRSVEGWELKQFDPSVLGLYQQCLDLLPAVVTTEDADQWLTVCKTVLATSLEGKVRQ